MFHFFCFRHLGEEKDIDFAKGLHEEVVDQEVMCVQILFGFLRQTCWWKVRSALPLKQLY